MRHSLVYALALLASLTLPLSLAAQEQPYYSPDSSPSADPPPVPDGYGGPPTYGPAGAFDTYDGYSDYGACNSCGGGADACGCGSSGTGQCFDACSGCNSMDCCCDLGRITAGFAFTFLQPHFESNVALRRTRTDNSSFSSSSEASFDNDFDLSPRIWLEYTRPVGLGARITYWGFDHDSPGVAASPANAGFDTVSAPRLDLVDTSGLTTNIVGETYEAQSSIDAHLLDFEGTKQVQFEHWSLWASGGFRYVGIGQSYHAVLRDDDGDAVGTLDTGSRFDGIGPTMSIEARRDCGCLTLFSHARGSVLYGNGKSGALVGENLDTAQDFFTSATERHNDLLTIAEVQFGLEWTEHLCNGSLFYTRCALEGQVWQGAGSATSRNSDLGFFGLSVGLGLAM